jgi:hypothetical protein
VKLDELHVLERRTRVVRERMTVAGVLPAVARDLVGPADAAGREDDGRRTPDAKAPPLALVSERPGDALSILEEARHGALHVHLDVPLVDRVVLERADHLETRPVAHVRESRIAMTAEIPLKDAPIGSAVEQRAPGLELPHAVRRLLGVQLGHAPVVDVLPAAHRVREVDAPAVPIIDVRQRRRDTALGHHRVRLAEQ